MVINIFGTRKNCNNCDPTRPVGRGQLWIRVGVNSRLCALGLGGNHIYGGGVTLL